MKSDWKNYKIGEFAKRSKIPTKVADSISYKRLTIRMHGLGVVLRDEVSGSLIGTKNQFFAKGGQFLLSKIDARNGAFGILSQDLDGALISNSFQAYDLDKNIIDIDYFNYFTKTHSFIDFCSKASEGTTNRRNLDDNKFLSFEIPLPPLPEQKRIVKKIKEIEEKVKKINEINKGEYRFSELLIEEVFIKFISKNWVKKELGNPDIAKISSGGTPSRGNSKYYNGNIVWLKSGELKDNLNIIDSEEKITDKAIEDSSAKIFEVGTVLLAMYGATVGKVGILGVPAATNQAVAAIKVNERKLFNKYLFYFLKSLRKDLIATGFGGAQPNISQNVVKKILIPLPEIDEQKKLVKKFEEFLAKINLVNKEIKKTSEYSKFLMPSVLAKAFNGDL